ncbi:MAG: pyruvate formate lyase family protein [Eubacteriales bacterium]|nr:pyruvate formate lyase family protein [Eubacteriales bacterium]
MKYYQTTEELKKEINLPVSGKIIRDYYMGIGYKEQLDAPVPVARANAFRTLLTRTKKHVYDNDIIVGSMRGLFEEGIDEADYAAYGAYTARFGRRGWLQGCDHYASAYDRLISMGVRGIRDEIAQSTKRYEFDRGKVEFLKACDISILGFSEMIQGYAKAARDPEIRQVCLNIAEKPASSFREALQLVWFGHLAYLYQGLYAMALGRIDQYLYPYYKNDTEKGILTQEEAQLMLENVFMKIGEYRTCYGGDDVCNICIAGITPEGDNAVNDLTYAVLRAVGKCNIPGPNLSARINPKTPDKFLEEALGVIGTGLGYPALMNDTPNIKALMRMGYEERDANNYCMVGCIENFLPGMQPPWSDGRFDSVKFLEYTLNSGYDMQTGKRAGIDTGNPCDWESMDEFMAAYESQLADAASEYACSIRLEHGRYNNKFFVNPFMSCLTYCCVERGLDIANGGTIYPSAHGACGMGIGTVTDSLAAIEKLIYKDKTLTMETLLQALKANFEGYEGIRQQLLDVPKYGNDCDETDKWAVWYVDYLAELFDGQRLHDGGRFYTAIASNTSNIPAGAQCAATPDGRMAREPQSDAASPTYGRDRRGPTCTVKSVSKPDYTRVACGTVVNQKFSPDIFRGENNIKRLAALIRVYFKRGGQEMQINSVSRDILMDAMEHPENYANLVVRVSGFSAYYVNLDRSVQIDILNRTEHA